MHDGQSRESKIMINISIISIVILSNKFSLYLCLSLYCLFPAIIVCLYVCFHIFCYCMGHWLSNNDTNSRKLFLFSSKHGNGVLPYSLSSIISLARIIAVECMCINQETTPDV